MKEIHWLIFGDNDNCLIYARQLFWLADVTSSASEDWETVVGVVPHDEEPLEYFKRWPYTLVTATALALLLLGVPEP